MMSHGYSGSLGIAVVMIPIEQVAVPIRLGCQYRFSVKKVPDMPHLLHCMPLFLQACTAIMLESCRMTNTRIAKCCAFICFLSTRNYYVCAQRVTVIVGHRSAYCNVILVSPNNSSWIGPSYIDRAATSLSRIEASSRWCIHSSFHA